MSGKHVNKRQCESRVYLIIVFAAVLILTLFSYTNFSFADNSALNAWNGTNNISNADGDMNYATKEYWDNNYGPHEGKYLKSLTPGQTLGVAGQTTDYFIADNLSVVGSVGNPNPAGIVIAGRVNLYFEAKDNKTEGPTLSATGGSSTNQLGAGAGIEVIEGNELYVYGRGTLIAQGGNVDWYSHSFTPGNGGPISKDGIKFHSGSGGYGGNGSGGSGAGIGTNGANGGVGANTTPGITKNL